MRVSSIDWEAWEPHDTVAITYVVREDQILLIHKKRGLGAGKINVPGGRLEPGETPAEAASRELFEEVGVRTLASPQWRGEHRHQFVDGFALHIHVFVTHQTEGQPVETDEALPFWSAPDAIPFDRMWADNRLWVPAILSGQLANGRFVFDGDVMLDHKIVFKNEPNPT